VVQGGATDDDGDNENDDEGDDDDDGDEEEDDEPKGKSKLTQRQVNAIMAKEKRDGKRSGRREVLEELGFKTLEEAKKALQRKTEKDADTDDADNKAIAEAKDKLREAEKERDALKFQSKLERQLLAADALPGKVEKAVRLLDLEQDASADEIAEAIEDLRDDIPALFKANSDDGDDDDESGSSSGSSRRKGTEPAPQRRKVKDSDAGSRRKKPQTASPQARAKARLAERHPNYVNKN
jgi:hypothetical protein